MAANTKRLQERNKFAQRKKREAELKKRKYVAIAGIVVCAAMLLLFFVPFAYVYNTGTDKETGNLIGTEVSVNGWNCFFAALTNTYDSANRLYGDMNNPFNVWANNYSSGTTDYSVGMHYTTVLCVFALLSMAALLATFVLQILVVAKENYKPNVAVIACEVAAALLLLVCFITALSMKNANILSGYCSGNTLCSIRSLAILPMLLMSAMAGVQIYFHNKFTKIERELA